MHHAEASDAVDKKQGNAADPAPAQEHIESTHGKPAGAESGTKHLVDGDHGSEAVGVQHAHAEGAANQSPGGLSHLAQEGNAADPAPAQEHIESTHGKPAGAESGTKHPVDGDHGSKAAGAQHAHVEGAANQSPGGKEADSASEHAQAKKEELPTEEKPGSGEAHSHHSAQAPDAAQQVTPVHVDRPPHDAEPAGDDHKSSPPEVRATAATTPTQAPKGEANQAEERPKAQPKAPRNRSKLRNFFCCRGKLPDEEKPLLENDGKHDPAPAADGGAAQPVPHEEAAKSAEEPQAAKPPQEAAEPAAEPQASEAPKEEKPAAEAKPLEESKAAEVPNKEKPAAEPGSTEESEVVAKSQADETAKHEVKAADEPNSTDVSKQDKPAPAAEATAEPNQTAEQQAAPDEKSSAVAEQAVKEDEHPAHGESIHGKPELSGPPENQNATHPKNQQQKGTNALKNHRSRSRLFGCCGQPPKEDPPDEEAAKSAEKPEAGKPALEAAKPAAEPQASEVPKEDKHGAEAKPLEESKVAKVPNEEKPAAEPGSTEESKLAAKSQAEETANHEAKAAEEPNATDVSKQDKPAPAAEATAEPNQTAEQQAAKPPLEEAAKPVAEPSASEVPKEDNPAAEAKPLEGSKAAEVPNEEKSEKPKVAAESQAEETAKHEVKAASAEVEDKPSPAAEATAEPNQPAKQQAAELPLDEAEEAENLPDDTVQWMWGDAGKHFLGHALAELDPLHWSNWKHLGATIIDLEKYRDANRPVQMRTKRTMDMLYFDTVVEALIAFRKEASEYELIVETDSEGHAGFDLDVSLRIRAIDKRRNNLHKMRVGDKILAVNGIKVLKKSDYSANAKGMAKLQLTLLRESMGNQAECCTTLKSAANAGDTKLDVVSTSGFQVGQTIVIDPGAIVEERNEILGLGSILVRRPLTFAHVDGATVRKVGPKIPNTKHDAPAMNKKGDTNAVSDEKNDLPIAPVRVYIRSASNLERPGGCFGNNVSAKEHDIYCSCHASKRGYPVRWNNVYRTGGAARSSHTAIVKWETYLDLLEFDAEDDLQFALKYEGDDFDAFAVSSIIGSKEFWPNGKLDVDLKMKGLKGLKEDPVLHLDIIVNPQNAVATLGDGGTPPVAQTCHAMPSTCVITVSIFGARKMKKTYRDGVCVCAIPNKAPLHVGDTVIAVERFSPNNRNAYEINKGSRGVIRNIDSDGNAFIIFAGYEGHAMVSKSRFNLLTQECSVRTKTRPRISGNDMVWSEHFKLKEYDPNEGLPLVFDIFAGNDKHPRARAELPFNREWFTAGFFEDSLDLFEVPKSARPRSAPSRPTSLGQLAVAIAIEHSNAQVSIHSAVPMAANSSAALDLPEPPHAPETPHSALGTTADSLPAALSADAHLPPVSKEAIKSKDAVAEEPAKPAVEADDAKVSQLVEESAPACKNSKPALDIKDENSHANVPVEESSSKPAIEGKDMNTHKDEILDNSTKPALTRSDQQFFGDEHLNGQQVLEDKCLDKSTKPALTRSDQEFFEEWSATEAHLRKEVQSLRRELEDRNRLLQESEDSKQQLQNSLRAQPNVNSSDRPRQAKRQRPQSARRKKPPDVLGMLFLRHDLNGNGKLEAAELEACLHEVFGQAVTQNIVDKVLEEYPHGVSRLTSSGNLCKDIYELFRKVDQLVHG